MEDDASGSALSKQATECQGNLLLLLWVSIFSRHLRNFCGTNEMLLILPTRPVTAKDPSRVSQIEWPPMEENTECPGDPTQSCQASKVLRTLHLNVCKGWCNIWKDLGIIKNVLDLIAHSHMFWEQWMREFAVTSTDVCRFKNLSTLTLNIPPLSSEGSLHWQAYRQSTRWYYGQVWTRQIYKTILNPWYVEQPVQH